MATTSTTEPKIRRAILGKKLGMTQLFEEDGRWIPVTALQAGPCTVLQVKTPEKDGYAAVQIGFDDRRKPARRPQQAVLDRLGVSPKRFVKEIPFVDPAHVLRGGDANDEAAAAADGGDSGAEGSGGAEGSDGAEGADGEASSGGDGASTVAPGDRIGVGVLAGVGRVDVRGISKGRGFAGTIKRHGFNAGDKGHGSKNVREPGSTGMHTDPGRVLKGKKMPGHHGAANCKVRNLEVVRLDEKNNLLLVKGAVPGPRGGYLYIEESL